MPYAFLIDPVRRLVVSRMTGVIVPQDSVAWTREVTHDPHFDPSFDHLCSFETVTGVDVSVPAVQLASALSPFNEASRRAFIMPSDLLYGLGRAFQLSLSDAAGRHRLFRDRAGAVAWLGLDAEAAELIDRLGSGD
jgi:hypothetical protein